VEGRRDPFEGFSQPKIVSYWRSGRLDMARKSSGSTKRLPNDRGRAEFECDRVAHYTADCTRRLYRESSVALSSLGAQRCTPASLRAAI
jgi:hypothetical protein